MQLVKHLKSDSLIIDTDGVVKAATYQQMLDTQTILDEAHKRAQAITAEAEATREDIFAKARLKAEAEVESQALRETMARAAQLELWVDAIKPKLAQAVSLAIQKMIHTIPSETRLRNMLTEALGELANVQDLSIRLHPSQADWLRQSLPQLRKDSQFGGSVQIQPDETLKAGDCILESPLGVIDLRLQAQLRLLQQAVDDA